MKKTNYFFIAASILLYYSCNKQFQEETIKEAAKIERIKDNRVLKTDTQNNSAEYDIIDEFYPQDDDLQTLVTSFNLELENYYANESVYENRTIDVAKWLL